MEDIDFRILQNYLTLFHIVTETGLLDMIPDLTEKEKHILVAYLSERKSFSQIAVFIHSSRSHVRVMYDRALLKLNHGVADAISTFQRTDAMRIELESLRAEIIRMQNIFSEHKIKHLKETLDPDKLSTDIQKLNFSDYTYRALRHLHIKMLGDLLEYSEEKLLRSKYIGHKVIREVKEKLSEIDMEL